MRSPLPRGRPFLPGPALAVALLACACASGLAVAAAGAAAPVARPQGQAGASDALEEYRALLASLGRQALGNPRLAAPMPCLPHWLAGADPVIVAVSGPGAIAGLRTGDRLRRIGEAPVSARSGELWDAVLRRLSPDTPTYLVETGRGDASTVVELPCAPARAARLHTAERAMWTAVTTRDWDGCLANGRGMLDAFGAAMSPPLLVMTRCAAAAGRRDAALVTALADALLDELVAHPEPSADQYAQLEATARELDLLSQESGVDHAGPVRRRMQALGAGATPGDQQPPAGR